MLLMLPWLSTRVVKQLIAQKLTLSEGCKSADFSSIGKGASPYVELRFQTKRADNFNFEKIENGASAQYVTLWVATQCSFINATLFALLLISTAVLTKIK